MELSKSIRPEYLRLSDFTAQRIKDFLGHSSANTTDIYAGFGNKKKQEALEELNFGIIKGGKSS